MTAGDLKRIDSRPIPDSREEIRAFMVVWNESLRLESMLNIGSSEWTDSLWWTVDRRTGR